MEFEALLKILQTVGQNIASIPPPGWCPDLIQSLIESFFQFNSDEATDVFSFSNVALQLRH